MVLGGGGTGAGVAVCRPPGVLASDGKVAERREGEVLLGTGTFERC